MPAINPQIILVVLVVTSTPSILTSLNQVNAQTNENSAKIVAAGGGNSTSPLTIFVPYNIEIKAGESVTWNNPTPVAEPHSVTFMKDSKYLDQRTYMGILNFRASTPVEVILGQRVPIDSATLSMVEKEFGDLEEGNITHGTVKVLAAGAVLKPQYGDSPQYYSASIPFIVDSIVLRANQPFVAVYLVSAQVQLPEPVIKIQN